MTIQINNGFLQQIAAATGQASCVFIAPGDGTVTFTTSDGKSYVTTITAIIAGASLITGSRVQVTEGFITVTNTTTWGVNDTRLLNDIIAGLK